MIILISSLIVYFTMQDESWLRRFCSVVWTCMSLADLSLILGPDINQLWTTDTGPDQVWALFFMASAAPCSIWFEIWPAAVQPKPPVLHQEESLELSDESTSQVRSAGTTSRPPKLGVRF